MKDFEDFLRKNNLAEKTISSYLFTIKKYFSIYDDITKKNLLTFKGDLVETYKPKTVNLRIQAVNKYLDYVGKEKLKLKFVKIQQRNFLENVISDADYKFLKNLP